MNTQDTQEAGRQLRQLAAAIDTYRADLGMSKVLLLRNYPELGTDKTYNKIVKGDLAELDIEGRWLDAYRTTWAHIQGESAGADEALIDDLAGPVDICRAYLETRHEKGNARFIALLGDSGVGKTSAIEVMRAKPYGVNILLTEAIEAWKARGKGTAVPLLRAIGRALGIAPDYTIGRDQLFETVAEKLNAQRKCVVIEEAHHLAPDGLNTIKNLINRTPVLVIITAMPILWQRLESSREGYAECRQLITNRLAEKIFVELRESDVRALLAARLGLDESDALIGKVIGRLMEDARSYGNLKFVDKVAKRYVRGLKQGEPAVPETFANAIQIEKRRRGGARG